jgi:hypothetical protein
MSTSEYLLAGQVSELERLKLQSRVWEPSGRRLLEQIGDGRGARAVDIGSRAWSTPLEGAGQWVLQVGYDLFDDGAPFSFRPRGLPWEWQA